MSFFGISPHSFGSTHGGKRFELPGIHGRGVEMLERTQAARAIHRNCCFALQHCCAGMKRRPIRHTTKVAFKSLSSQSIRRFRSSPYCLDAGIAYAAEATAAGAVQIEHSPHGSGGRNPSVHQVNVGQPTVATLSVVFSASFWLESPRVRANSACRENLGAAFALMGMASSRNKAMLYPKPLMSGSPRIAAPSSQWPWLRTHPNRTHARAPSISPMARTSWSRLRYPLGRRVVFSTSMCLYLHQHRTNRDRSNC